MRNALTFRVIGRCFAPVTGQSRSALPLRDRKEFGNRMALDENMAELPLDGVGARLRNAREAAGMTRADIAGITKIPERQLIALEDGNYAALPARTYATGFARSYARAVGLNEEAILKSVREELHGTPTRSEKPNTTTFEPGDPARIPSRLVAGIALAVVVVLVIGIAFWRSRAHPVSDLPSILPSDAPMVAGSAAPPSPAASSLPAANGPVVFTAQAPDVWVRFYDASGKDLLQKHMAEGESFTVPADAVDPKLRTGRPDALAITIGGHAVAKLADKQMMMDAVPVSAAALLARSSPAKTTPTPAPVAMTSHAPATAHPSLHPQHSVGRAPMAAASAAAFPATTPAPAPANPSTATQ